MSVLASTCVWEQLFSLNLNNSRFQSQMMDAYRKPELNVKSFDYTIFGTRY